MPSGTTWMDGAALLELTKISSVQPNVVLFGALISACEKEVQLVWCVGWWLASLVGKRLETTFIIENEVSCAWESMWLVVLKQRWNLNRLVDGRNPAPVDIINIIIFLWCHTSQVVSRISSMNSMINCGVKSLVEKCFKRWERNNRPGLVWCGSLLWIIVNHHLGIASWERVHILEKMKPIFFWARNTLILGCPTNLVHHDNQMGSCRTSQH